MNPAADRPRDPAIDQRRDPPIDRRRDPPIDQPRDPPIDQPRARVASGPQEPEGRRPDGWPGGGGKADAVFAALADPTRRRLLDELSEGGPRSATELAPRYPMSRQAVVKHLGVLADAGLVTARRDGRDVRYQLERDALTDATAWLAEVGRRWDDRLDALRRHLADRGGGRS